MKAQTWENAKVCREGVRKAKATLRLNLARDTGQQAVIL